jgi:hypothetical protein
MSPDQPTTKQISPLASALRYSEEWNFLTEGRIFVSSSAAFSSSFWSFEFGLNPRKCSAAGTRSSAESSICTPQSRNFARFSGLNTISQLSILPFDPSRSRIAFTL